MDQAITRAAHPDLMTGTGAPRPIGSPVYEAQARAAAALAAISGSARPVGEFEGYVDGVEPSVRWLDRTNMPQVGDRLFAIPPRAAVPRSWSILLTSANHGTVGPVGSTFPHAGEKHERVQVMEIVEAGAPPAPGVDLAGLVRFDFSDLDGENEQFGEVAGGAYFLAHQVEARCAGAAPIAGQAGGGASTVLTDERITEIEKGMLDHWASMNCVSSVALIAFARAIEREVAAQAGQVAVPEDLARDAARYRYLRNSDAEARSPYIVRDTNNKYFGPSWLEGARADEAIDTAMVHDTSSPVKEQK